MVDKFMSHRVDPDAGLCPDEFCDGELRLRGVHLGSGGRWWAVCTTCEAQYFKPSRHDWDHFDGDVVPPESPER